MKEAALLHYAKLTTEPQRTRRQAKDEGEGIKEEPAGGYCGHSWITICSPHLFPDRTTA